VKVLFISSMYHKPGRFYAGDKIHRLAVELMRVGVEVQVVCPIPRFERPRLRGGDPASGPPPHVGSEPLCVDGVSIRYLGFPNLPLGLLAGAHVGVLRWYILRAIEKLRPAFPFQLIHAHRLFPTGFAAMQIADALSIPLVASAVGSDVHTDPSRNRAIRTRTKDTIRKSGAVLAVSRTLANQIEALETPRRPVRVVYRGVDVDRFAARSSKHDLRVHLGLPLEGLGICTVGRLVRAKGILELFGAFEQLATEFPHLWLSVIGEGPLRAQLESEIVSKGLEGRVFWRALEPMTKSRTG
jgi:teichuronic acid biosynthesis glycosyltransferase TuaC